MPKSEILEGPDLKASLYWHLELAKLLRALTVLTVVFINKIKEEKR